MIRRGIFIATTIALFAGPAFASSCPKHMAAIDAALPGAQLSDADKAKVMELRQKGEDQHKAGDHAASVDSLTQAKEILGIK